jgi:hypothetical protein
MAKSVVNPVYAESSRVAYAKGGFVPRRKGQHRDHDLLPDFVNQQGVSCDFSTPGVSPIVSVEFLGTFVGYGNWGAGEVTYRAHKVTLANGLRVPAYSLNEDQYVMCQHTGFKAY